MTSYGGEYYDFMKKLKFRSFLRVWKGLKFFLGKEPNWQYVTSEHIKYLYYKKEMKRWRTNIKNVKVLKKRFEVVS